MRFSGSRLFRALFLCLLLFVLSACTTLSDVAHPNLTPSAQATGDPSQLVPFDLGIPTAAIELPDGSDLPDTTSMHIIVTFKVSVSLLQQLGGQTRSKAGQSIDLSTLANQLGIDAQIYKQMQTFFGGPGTSIYLNNLRTNMTIDAQAGTLAKRLKTQFARFNFHNTDFFAPYPSIQLPRSLTDQIQAIVGLDNYSKYPGQQRTALNKQPLQVKVNQDGCSMGQDNLVPSQVSQAYGFNTLYQHNWEGQGTTIILPEFDGFSQSDVQHYLKCVNFQGTLHVVNVDNVPPEQDDNDGSESLLDIEMVAGLAPDANIVVYQANAGANDENFWSKMLDIFNQISNDYATHQQPVIVSLSWGDSEDYLTNNTLTSVDNYLQLMSSVEHLNVFVASGDCGAYSSADYPNTLDVGYPASDPYVISVGGTILHVNSQDQRTSEVVWSENPQDDPSCDNGWGSGGGLSGAFPRPSWQQGYIGIQNKYSDGKRQVPDVSAAAYYLAIYEDGAWDYSGGTSAAAPIWASAYALLNQGLVSQTDYYVSGPALFYLLATRYSQDNPYYDVQSGNNTYYPATPGWDYATGLGTPNLQGIYKALAAYVQSMS